jgi:hypothetical protein
MRTKTLKFARSRDHVFPVTILLIIVLFAPACAGASPPPATAPLATFTLPTASPTQTPTLVSLALNLSEVVTYTHSSGTFKMQHPAGWQLFERDDGVITLAPENQAGLTVVFNNVAESYTPAQLEQYLLGFIARNFDQDAPGFEAMRLQQHTDGAVTAVFAAADAEMGLAVNQVRVRQENEVIYLAYTSVPQPAWESAAEPLQWLLESVTPLDTAATDNPTPTPPVWVLTGPKNQEFGFLMATDWEIVERGDNRIELVSPSGKMTFVADNFVWPAARTDPHASREAALAHLAQLTEVYSDVQSLPPQPFPLDDATGATIDFIYTGTDGQQVAGSIITGVSNGKMHKIVFSAPVDFYDAALEWFNTMYKSFRFLSPEMGLDE